MRADELEWRFDDFCWTASAVLPAWAGFRDASDLHIYQTGPAPSDGRIELAFEPGGLVLEPGERGASPPSPDDLGLVQWVLDNAEIQANAVLRALLAHYPTIREDYADFYTPGQAESLLPPVANVDEFKQLIGLIAIGVHPVIKDGVPYVGYEFGSRWSDEHGLGLMMHGERCVEIGAADTATGQWIAEQDIEGVET